MKILAAQPKLVELVQDAILTEIASGRLPPGSRIIQEQLAHELGVSRQPVQQAMALLKNEGLVLEMGARGLYVAPLDGEATVHHYQIRLSLDLLAARLTAERALESPAFAKRLLAEGERILAAGDHALAKGSYRDAVAMDVEFHSFIYEMSGNPLIVGAAEPHWSYLRRVMIAVLNYAERGKTVWAQHREILEAMAAGKTEVIGELVTAHIKGAEAAFLRVLPSVAEPEPVLTGRGRASLSK
jgi:DNA-binding GntR family transcriptional regulator